MTMSDAKGINRMRLFPIVLMCLFAFALQAQVQVSEPPEPQSANQTSEVQKVALVIGVENYDFADKVTNAVNDALEFSHKLLEVGFAPSKIHFVQDPQDNNRILDEVSEVASSVGNTDEPVIFVFYFAGHGFQDGG